MNRTNRTKYTAYLLGLISVCSNFSSKINAGNHGFSSSKKHDSSPNTKKNGIKKWGIKNPDGKYLECKFSFNDGHLRIIAKKSTFVCEIFTKENIFLKPYIKSVSFEGNINSICGICESQVRENRNTCKHNLKNCDACKYYEDLKNCDDDEEYKIKPAVIKSAFNGCENLTSIKLPKSVTKIGDSAFLNCTNLTSIIIPDKVEKIENNAFNGCKNLTSIELPKSVTKIGDSAFLNCTNLTSIVIPDKVEKIGNNAFFNCISLSAINFEGKEPKIEAIGRNAFGYCISLTSFKIPKSIKQIGENVFGGCTSLSNISIPYGIEVVDSVNVDIDLFVHDPFLYRILNGKFIGTINDRNDLVNYLGLKYDCINFLI